ncbi:MAG: DUF6458 family protein [Actinomycetota bacterium]|jgi:Domain of unknown function (DUF6458)|nr:DUF6458 family protein [Actinomycetota bacterium]
MGVGVSIFLIAVGLILWLAINVDTDGRVDINMIGVILVIVGAIGLLLSMIFWSSWGGPGGWRRDTVVRDDRYDRPPPY